MAVAFVVDGVLDGGLEVAYSGYTKTCSYTYYRVGWCVGEYVGVEYLHR